MGLEWSRKRRKGVKEKGTWSMEKGTAEAECDVLRSTVLIFPFMVFLK